MALPLHINIQSGIPVYRQLLDQIRHLAICGSLRPGDPLPSIRELAAELALNPSTIVKTYDLLAQEGLVEKRPGAGVFMLAPPTPRLDPGERESRIRADLQRLLPEWRSLGSSPSQIMRLLGEELEKLE